MTSEITLRGALTVFLQALLSRVPREAALHPLGAVVEVVVHCARIDQRLAVALADRPRRLGSRLGERTHRQRHELMIGRRCPALRERHRIDVFVQVRADGERRVPLHVGGAVDEVGQRIDMLARARRADQAGVAVLVDAHLHFAVGQREAGGLPAGVVLAVAGQHHLRPAPVHGTLAVGTGERRDESIRRQPLHLLAEGGRVAIAQCDLEAGARRFDDIGSRVHHLLSCDSAGGEAKGAAIRVIRSRRTE